MKLTRKTVTAVAAVASVGLVGLSLAAPATAATRSTVVIVSSNAMTSLNSGTPDTNLTINGDIAYLSGSGFIYYDNSPKLVRNTAFGTFKVTKNTPTDVRVTYTVNKGRLWSDGTPITAVDLLMSHVLSSSEWSKAAGLGDPLSEDGGEFNSLGYGGIYDENIVGNPTLSADKMSLTLRYKKFLPDWEVLGPGPSPVHALQLLSEGKKGLQSVKNNIAAKNRWLTAYNAKATARFKAIAKIWNTDYNITNIGPDTNKLLLVSNGGFMVQSAVATQSTTLVRNPRYNSGPKFTGNVKKVVFRYIGDGTAAAQALKNREIDIYQGQPTAEAVAQLKAIRTAKVIGGTNSCYEHVDLTIGALEGSTYDGLWQGYSTRSKELRTAFLLAFPRAEIISKLIKPINSTAVVLDSVFTLPGAPGYAEIKAGSGISKYSAGTQAQRTAQALALVKKYFPNTSAENPTVDVRLLWGTPTNQRRSAQSQIIKAAVAKAGFNITNNAAGDAGWGGKLGSDTYDAAFFAWCPTSLSQTGTNANFESTGSNNYQGYNNPAMDTVLKKFEGSLTLSQLKANYVAAEKLLIEDAATLGIFQHPQATAHNALLKNVKPAPLSPNLVWNFWQWAY